MARQELIIARISERMESKIDLRSAEGTAFDSYHDELDARCHPDTREDLLHAIKEWAHDLNGKCIFWLKGMVSTGKSIIAQTVAECFDADGLLGARFFFKRGEGERGNASRFFTTIALDLVCKVPALVPYVKNAIESDPRISGKSLKDQFEKLILQPLSQAMQTSMQITTSMQIPTLVIVVDALDECEREGDIRMILRLLLQTQHLQTVHVHIFLTSRPELSIRLEFEKISADVHQDVVLQDILQSMIEHDISVYFTYELGRIKDEYNVRRSPDCWLPSDWPGDENIWTLTKMAVPLFIFAATVCRFVGNRKRDPKSRLANFLEQPASHVSSLERTYLPVLQ